MSELIFELAVILGLIFANGVFAGAEIALVTVRTSRLQERASQGSSAARCALALKQQPESLLATVQIGITVVGSTAAVFGGAAAGQRLAPLIAYVPWLAPHAQAIALTLTVAIVSYLTIVLGELVPKSLALRSAEAYALVVAPPLLWLSWFARPIVRALTLSSNLVLRPLGDRTNFGESRYSTEEIQQLVEEAKRSGVLHPRAAEIASRAMDFPELTAAEVMVPRQRVVMLQHDASIDEIHRIIIEQPHRRFPVYGANADDVVGYVNLKDLAARSWQQEATKLDEMLRPPYFVPYTKPVADLLTELQKLRVPLAMVIEAQGGLAGIVTIEDLVEELVGDIFNENEPDASKSFKREADRTWVIAGDVPVRAVNRSLGLDLPEDGTWNTLAGLFIGLAGRIPAAGERQILPDGVEIEVVEASPRRVRSLRLRAPRLSAPALPSDASGS